MNAHPSRRLRLDAPRMCNARAVGSIGKNSSQSALEPFCEDAAPGPGRGLLPGGYFLSASDGWYPLSSVGRLRTSWAGQARVEGTKRQTPSTRYRAKFVT